MTPLTIPWPLRFLNWSAGDWAGRGVGCALFLAGLIHAAIGWALIRITAPSLSGGYEWVIVPGLLCVALAPLLLWAGGHAIKTGLPSRDQRLGAAAASLAGAVPGVWAAINLCEFWAPIAAHPPAIWPDYLDLWDRSALTWLSLMFLAVVGSLLLAALGRSRATHDGPTVRRAPIAVVAIAAVGGVLWFAPSAPPDGSDAGAMWAGTLRFLRTGPGTALRAVEGFHVCPAYGTQMFMPRRRINELVDPDLPWGYESPGARLLECGPAAVRPHRDDLAAALGDPHYDPSDRHYMLQRLYLAPELLREFRPLLSELAFRAPVSAAGVGHDYQLDRYSMRQLRLRYGDDIRRAAEFALEMEDEIAR